MCPLLFGMLWYTINMNIIDKTFVVTGAASGIGKALTIGLLARGARVAAVDRNAETLNALQDELQAGERLSLHPLDITDREAVYSLPEAVIAAHGAVDGVINNAGVIQPFVKIADLDYESIERVINVNFYGTVNMIKALLPHFMQRPEAHIVNVSSMGGFLPVPGQSVYGASKAAVKLLSEGLYAELQGTNVGVTTVFPGATNTNITANSGVDTSRMAEKAGDSSTPMLSADQAAAIVINGIERNKPLVYTGKDSLMMNRLYRLSPVRATKLIASKMKSLLE